MLTGRGVEWSLFADKVFQHINSYTIKQYGDMGDDQLTDYTAEDCIKQVQKYCNRFGKNQRDGQQELDLIKAAHYLCVAHSKLGG